MNAGGVREPAAGTKAFSARPLTAPGLAAIAAVRLWGPGAAAFLKERLFSRAKAAQRSGGGSTMRLPDPGRFARMTWTEAGTVMDDVMVVGLPAGVGDGYELHGHGGRAGLAAWQKAVKQAGGAWIEPLAGAADGAISREVMLGSLETAESWAADFAEVWSRVQTERQARVVASSAAQIARLWREQPDRRRWSKECLRSLVAGGAERLALLHTYYVLLAGPVNAGKSTLLNALLSDRRALTSALPGTTRDPVRGRMELGGLVIEWIDTAGLRSTGEAVSAIEQRGIVRTLETQAQVDLTVWLSPADQPMEPPAAWQNLLVVQSKVDLAPRGRLGDVPGHLAISAQSGTGLAELCAEVGKRLIGPALHAQNSLSSGICSTLQRQTVERWLAE